MIECLPNEILIEIFQYLNARCVYQAFYNLNQRLTNLLDSLTHLYLELRPNENNKYDYLFTSRIQTLIVHNHAQFRLVNYPNLHRLILYNSKDEQISQLFIDGLQLTSISLISPRCFYSTFILHEKIFSNQYPCLKSSYLTNVYSPSNEIRQLSWNQCLSLQYLRISSHDSLIHIAILNACPNLYSLDLCLLNQFDPTPIQSIRIHDKLKRLKFQLKQTISHANEIDLFESFFSLLPNLELLSLQCSTNCLSKIFSFDTFAMILQQKCTYLKVFRLSLHLSTQQTKPILCQLKENFQKMFSSYQYSSFDIIHM